MEGPNEAGRDTMATVRWRSRVGRKGEIERGGQDEGDSLLGENEVDSEGVTRSQFSLNDGRLVDIENTWFYMGDYDVQSTQNIETGREISVGVTNVRQCLQFHKDISWVQMSI